MTLTEVIHTMEVLAAGTPSINSIVRNDIFRLNSLPDAKYAVFGWTQGQHSASVDSSLLVFNFTLFYIDRLTETQGNQIEIQSFGIQVLDNLIRSLYDQGITADTPYTFQTFNERFLDECAGVFTNVALSVPVSGLCADYFADFNEDFNDDFAIGGATIY